MLNIQEDLNSRESNTRQESNQNLETNPSRFNTQEGQMRSLMQSSEGGDFIDRLNTSLAGDESSLGQLQIRNKPIPHVDLDGRLDELIRLPAGLATNRIESEMGGDSTIRASLEATQRFH